MSLDKYLLFMKTIFATTMTAVLIALGISPNQIPIETPQATGYLAGMLFGVAISVIWFDTLRTLTNDKGE